MISKISKEKQIFLESFDRRNLNRNNTQKLMDRMMNYRLSELKKSRTDNYKKDVKYFKSQGETFDISKLGFSQKERLSPTSKSNVRSFKSLEEQRENEFWTELDEILESLEKD